MNRSSMFAVIFFLASTSPHILFGQRTIDEFKDNINNKNLKFEVAIVGVTRILDSNRIILQKNLVRIESMDIENVLSKFGNDKLVKTLIPLLADSTKDWYANVLLYQITERDAGPLIVITTREEWVKAYKQKDIVYWKNYNK